MPGVYCSTSSGLVCAGLRLPRPRLDIRTYAHDRAAASVTIELEAEFGPPAVRTERELRSHDAGDPPRPRYAVRRGYGLGRRGLHFPDLAIELDDGKSLAVEIELTAKGTRRLDSIVRAYLGGRHHCVRYYAAPAALGGVGPSPVRGRGTSWTSEHWSSDGHCLTADRGRAGRERETRGMTSSLLTAAEVAELLGVPTSWVYQQSRAGRIPTVTLGRYRRYRREAIETWLEHIEAGWPGSPGGSRVA